MASCNFRTLGLSKFHWFRRSFFTRIVLFHGGSTYGHQLGLAFIFLILWIFTSFWAPLLAEICVILEKTAPFRTHFVECCIVGDKEALNACLILHGAWYNKGKHITYISTVIFYISQHLETFCSRFDSFPSVLSTNTPNKRLANKNWWPRDKEDEEEETQQCQCLSSPTKHLVSPNKNVRPNNWFEYQAQSMWSLENSLLTIQLQLPQVQHSQRFNDRVGLLAEDTAMIIAMRMSVGPKPSSCKTWYYIRISWRWNERLNHQVPISWISTWKFWKMVISGIPGGPIFHHISVLSTLKVNPCPFS